MDGAQIISELLTPAGRANPYPLYAAAHRNGPASTAQDGFVLVHGYAEVNQLLRSNAFGAFDPALRDGWMPEWRDRPSVASMAASILNANAPDHGRMRSLISSVFTPRRVAELEPAIAAAADGLLDRLAEQGSGGAPVDFMEEFAYRLPVSVICEMLGIPEADRDTFRRLAGELAAVLDFVSDDSVLDTPDRAAVQLTEYYTALVAERRARPRADLVSALIAACDADDGRLSETELLANLTLLLIAGFETTSNLFGNGVAELFAHPEVGEALRAGTLGYAGFIDEVLRHDSPVQLTSRVVLGEDTEIGGVPVRHGWEVAVMIGAANRDPRRYRDPDRFDPARTDVSPLSFGAGSHFCLGAVLARLEASVAFPGLLARFPALAPAGEPTRNSQLVLRGYRHLPVSVS